MLYMFIYETTNNINGKKYIGQHSTLDIDDGYIGSGVLLTKAINKYGKNNFSRKILQYANNKDELNELEKYYIDKFNAIESDMYYNIAEGGHNGNPLAGFTDKQMKEYRKKISEAMKGKNKGKQRSEETKQKISENNAKYWTGKQLSDETKQKMSQAKKGKNSPMYGKKGKDHNTSKPVIMFDIKGNILACFYSIGDANEHLGKPRYNSTICACLSRNGKTAFKYIWRYVNIITL